jgi:2-(3-amino-3-carboxypropyl)histidine synthase
MVYIKEINKSCCTICIFFITDHSLLHCRNVIQRSRSGRTYGLILGTLGRQGNRALFDRLRARLEARGKSVVRFLMAEINPAKLDLFSSIDVRNSTDIIFLPHDHIHLSFLNTTQVWVQVACPRLSIDWGNGFSKVLDVVIES